MSKPMSVVKRGPDARLVLSGHADQCGPEGYNRALSEWRAGLVKRFLVEQVRLFKGRKP